MMVDVGVFSVVKIHIGRLPTAPVLGCWDAVSFRATN